MVEIHLYGRLRRFNGKPQAGHDSVLRLEARPEETIATLLQQEGIPLEEINHIFVNAKLLTTRNAMAKFYGYPQARDSLSDWDMSVPVHDGDRLGLFGRDMAILSM